MGDLTPSELPCIVFYLMQGDVLGQKSWECLICPTMLFKTGLYLYNLLIVFGNKFS